jgi:hypothetical protein
MTASELFVTMKEVIRRSSEPGAVNINDKHNFQRQRSANTNWLDCIKNPAPEILRLADEGVSKWFDSLPDDLTAQGRTIWEQI